MAETFFLKSKFFQRTSLLKTNFSNICTCLPLILLFQRSTAVSLSLKTVLRMFFWSCCSLTLHSLWVFNCREVAFRTQQRSGRCYHAYHVFNTTSCWSLTTSNLRAGFLMKANSPFPSVIPVQLPETCYFNWANLTPFCRDGSERPTSWSEAAAAPSRARGMPSWMCTAPHKLSAECKPTEILRH